MSGLPSRRPSSVSSEVLMSETVVPSRLGSIDAMWHPPLTTAPRGAVLCVGGFDGGFNGPAEGIYGDLGNALPELGI